MWSSGASARDNWERLVATVIKREQIRQLCHQQSRSPSVSTISSSDDVSQRILSFSSMNLEPFSVPPSPLRPPNIPLLVSQVSNNAPSPRKLFSGWIPRRKSKNVVDDDIPAAEIYGGLIRFPLRELLVATDNFSVENMVGRGGFGKVYKGRLADGTLLAVKRLREESSTGGEIQFQTEVEIISIMGGHRNLRRLCGFCMTSKERILVYPYMSRGSAASCLRERAESKPPLSWATRKRIALGIAKGLAYLHEGISGFKIIHRDIKAANILLDDDSEATIGDFGLAIMVKHNVEDAATQNTLAHEELETVVGDFSLVRVMDSRDSEVTTAVRGTIGHIAPEYLATAKTSEKTDVFAYGITLLELITGQRAFDLVRLANDDDVMLLDWVKGLFKEKKLETLVDGDLEGDYVETEVEELMQVALLCTQSSPVDRPKMSEVLTLLEGDCLAEKCDEWQKMELFRQEANPVIADSEEDLNAEELSAAEPYVAIIRFSLREMLVATNNFSDANILGSGASGKVYKGRLEDGTLVAVKRQRTTAAELHSQSEAEIIRVMALHRNLLRLRGFCMTTTERILVYPYMSYRNLASFLRERPALQPLLSWVRRKRIALGIAKGVACLHEGISGIKIIHRDIKAANILLDDDFEAVIGDFGLAITTEHNGTYVEDAARQNLLVDEVLETVFEDFSLAKVIDPTASHVTTDVRGTKGHIAPEYLSTGKASEKTDVFAYGITLLELVTGQMAVDLDRLANGDHVLLLDWVKRLLKQKELGTLIDSELQGDYVLGEVQQLIQVALLCTQASPDHRPKMSEVLKLLRGDGLAEKWDEYWPEMKVFQQEANLGLHLSTWSHIKFSPGTSSPDTYGGLIRFPLRELQVATDNFSSKNILGRGGFGKVYKGRLADGTQVAIKRLKEEPTHYGEIQFQTEVEITSVMGGHRNLRRLHGFCMTSKERILVYPYMSNGSVAFCLRERPESEPPLSWATRKRIAVVAARGIAYLHEGISGIKIIHRDVKAANILLGDDSEAVIGDFGLALTAKHDIEDAATQNILGDEEFETVVGGFGLSKVMDCGDTHVTTNVRGTIGHIAPEYLSSGKASEKTDVFAYGVMLLELVTGQRAFDLARVANDEDAMLLDWVKGLLKEMRLEVLVDCNLQGNYVETEVEELMQVALLCTQSSPVDRPKMSEVLTFLEGDGLTETWAKWQKMQVLQQQANLVLQYPISE